MSSMRWRLAIAALVLFAWAMPARAQLTADPKDMDIGDGRRWSASAGGGALWITDVGLNERREGELAAQVGYATGTQGNLGLEMRYGFERELIQPRLKFAFDMVPGEATTITGLGDVAVTGLLEYVRYFGKESNLPTFTREPVVGFTVSRTWGAADYYTSGFVLGVSGRYRVENGGYELRLEARGLRVGI